MLAAICFGLAVLGGLAALLSGLGHRWGWWGFQTGFTILRWAAAGGSGVAVVSLFTCVLALSRRAWRKLILAAIALPIALASAGIPLSHMVQARGAPPIHDVTTNLDDPLKFVALLPHHQGAGNSARFSAHQLQAYPELAPVTYRLPPAQVFERALDVARGLGWEIVAVVPAEGRIEATERSFWFGFTDDIVIRVRSHPDGAQANIRSASRVGESDLGVNARRIKAFIDKLVAGSVP